MKSVYYTFTTWNDGQQAAGFDGSVDSGRRAALVRLPSQKTQVIGGGSVIDLAAWRAANQELWEGQPVVQPEAPARRVRSRRRRVHVDPELFAILGVVGVLAALMIRVLMF